jgi:hypothetical protein
LIEVKREWFLRKFIFLEKKEIVELKKKRPVNRVDCRRRWGGVGFSPHRTSGRKCGDLYGFTP